MKLVLKVVNGFKGLERFFVKVFLRKVLKIVFSKRFLNVVFEEFCQGFFEVVCGLLRRFQGVLGLLHEEGVLNVFERFLRFFEVRGCGG